MTEKTFTQKELAEILERQQLVYALDHAIQRGKLQGDSPDFINPLVNLYNRITAPSLDVQEKPAEPSDES